MATQLDINCQYCTRNGNDCDPAQCPKLKLYEESMQIQSFLEITASDNPAELIQRLTDINAYMARSGKLLADAKLMQDNVTASAYRQHSGFISTMPATVATKFIGSQAADVNYLVNMLDRVNRTCVHQADNIRTQISFAKQELALQRKGY